jgi:hypothetical protein
LIELKVVRRMLVRGLIVGPLAVLVAWVLGGSSVGIGAALGTGLALANLYLAGRIIGGIAENAPHLMLPGAMAAFMLGMVLLVLIAVLFKAVGGWSPTAAGIALIAAHLVLVMWEAANHLLKMPQEEQSQPVSGSAPLRS